ncbi:exodeoxyribonuclease V subunit alpha [Waddlia chondrophila]|uniref:RecBCD enzyme subunit RecD n=1 Tax=Waddlia chondrophila (strain ATCC VR-1470 / WSU 86-1044) TaxID=716544 RepID=D6YTF0_WADCW|nr:exodeoxyribonuclease V subunit alpha [Waddlia chondrophila]ADI37411.1 exodeoxyribonuclease V alpha chain [Waddlia chondrophila WSU 86-1044]
MASNSFPHRFSTLESAVKLKALSVVDLEFAKMLLESTSEADELLAALICHLTKSAREGHLCIKKTSLGLSPSPEEIWLRDCEEDIPSELMQLLKQIPGAFDRIPNTICTSVDSFSKTYPEQPICKHGRSLYLQKYWVFESHFLTHLLPLVIESPEFLAENCLLEDFLKKSPLNALQKKAVCQVFRQRFCVISGGPGTGKTHTAGAIVSLYSKMFKERLPKIALTAPTGKAASKLRSSLGSSDGFCVESYTLHALLGLSPESPYVYPPVKKLPYDLIIVDECSMIDVKLMASLLPSIKEGARLVFLGDPDQLPSVEAGSLFSDMIRFLDPSVIVRLEECLRVELKELVNFGKAVNEGRVVSYPKCVERIIPESQMVWEQELTLIQEILRFFPIHFTLEHTQEVFSAFRVLSPLRNGIFGVDQLNSKLLQFAYQKAGDGEEYAVPIMITRNHAKRGLFNGETGVLVREKGSTPYALGKNDYAIFGDRSIPALLLPAFEYAFCMSVHKSQGSEFEHVFLVMPQGSEWFGREMVYTAVTRAKKKLTLWGEETVIAEALGKCCRRFSGLEERISPFLMSRP